MCMHIRSCASARPQTRSNWSAGRPPWSVAVLAPAAWNETEVPHELPHEQGTRGLTLHGLPHAAAAPRHRVASGGQAGTLSGDPDKLVLARSDRAQRRASAPKGWRTSSTCRATAP